MRAFTSMLTGGSGNGVAYPRTYVPQTYVPSYGQQLPSGNYAPAGGGGLAMPYPIAPLPYPPGKSQSEFGLYECFSFHFSVR